MNHGDMNHKDFLMKAAVSSNMFSLYQSQEGKQLERQP
jgi:hypothetical protein